MIMSSSDAAISIFMGSTEPAFWAAVSALIHTEQVEQGSGKSGGQQAWCPNSPFSAPYTKHGNSRAPPPKRNDILLLVEVV